MNFGTNQTEVSALRRLPHYAASRQNQRGRMNYAELTDDELRANLPETGYWYAQLSPWGEMTTQARRSSRGNVRGEFGDHLRDLCERAGVPYLSAHKFRHGHAVYGLKRAQTVAQMKAISQNLMHSNMGITDGIYGKLVNDDVKNFISGL